MPGYLSRMSIIHLKQWSTDQAPLLLLENNIVNFALITKNSFILSALSSALVRDKYNGVTNPTE